MGYNEVRKVYTDSVLQKFDFWSHLARYGSIEQGIPGLAQKFKKWDTATHEAVADAAALRLVTAADRAASMMVPMAGATPDIYVFSATNTDADDGVTTICPADITHPAPGRWVKRSEAGGATTMVTETLAAGAADLVMVSGGADRTIVATTLDYRYNVSRILVSANLTIGVGGSTEVAYALPTKCLIRKGWIEVVTPIAGQTVDLGVVGYDLDGILAAASVNTTGYVDGPMGILMPDDFGGGGLNVAVTGGAAAAGAVVKAFVELVEMA